MLSATRIPQVTPLAGTRSATSLTALIALLSMQQSLWGLRELQRAAPAEGRNVTTDSLMPVTTMSVDQQAQLLMMEMVLLSRYLIAAVLCAQK